MRDSIEIARLIRERVAIGARIEYPALSAQVTLAECKPGDMIVFANCLYGIESHNLKDNETTLEPISGVGDKVYLPSSCPIVPVVK